MRELSWRSHRPATHDPHRGRMRGRLLQRFVLAAATLAMVAGVWFLPRAVSSGVLPTTGVHRAALQARGTRLLIRWMVCSSQYDTAPRNVRRHADLTYRRAVSSDW